MLDSDKSKKELIAELTALRQRLKDYEQGNVCTDSIDYKRSKEGADFYLTILDEAPALIWRAALDANCDWFNATWLAFTGRQLAQEIGNGWTENVHKDDFSHCLDTYLGAFHAHKFFEMEYRLRRHDGEYRWILDIGCPFKDVNGEFAGYIGYCFDVTARKQDEQFRAEVERIIRHDIKTPLAGLHGIAQLALGNGVDDDVRPLIPQVLRAVRHVISLVDSGETFTQIEKGEYRPQSGWFDVELILSDVESSLDVLINAKKVKLPKKKDPSCRGNGQVQCYGEEFLIHDMITNIVKNAVEASPEGRDVAICYGAEEGCLRLDVHNEGVVPEEIRAKFFDKYVTSGKKYGTGLGTYSAYLIAQAHGGRINLHTSDETGTTVSMYLPYPEGSGGAN